MNSYSYKKLFLFFMFFLLPVLFCLFGCASTMQYGKVPASALAPDTARINFTRDSGILGCGVPHIVLDKSQDVPQEGIVIRKNDTRYGEILWIEEREYITAVSCGIKILGKHKTHGIESLVTLQPGQSFDLGTLARPVQITYLAFLFSGWKSQIEVRNSINPDNITGILNNINAYKEKAHIIGMIGPRGTLQWDRPKGSMTIEVSEPVGDKMAYNIENVKAGKVTKILYHAPLGRIEVILDDNKN